MTLKQHRFGALALALISGATQAALVDRGNGMVYDTDRNLTWMANANLFGTQQAADPTLIARIIANVPTVSNGRTTHTLTTADFSSSTSSNLSGLMTWWGATAYADNLQYGGYSDWRLPSSLQPDAACSGQNVNAGISYGFGCTGSELGHLFYQELGGTARNNLTVPGNHNASFNLFSNVKSDTWTGTSFTGVSVADAAWDFSSYGEQSLLAVDNTFSFAWVVRTGDVAAVPEPESWALLLAGLGVMGFMARRRVS